ncbi:unnamed protein product [Adineta ricciae]|uniref:Methylthioribose-1-phosphate isomerase n=1 Tax=Adineta ricciae TaxID=249248 RepID=A0A813QCJ8_ADIRI|nr:unnamed protein product [Adineta ricciae]
MHVILLLIICLTSVNANCSSESDKSKFVREKMKTWGIYNQIYSVTSRTATYRFGICSLPNNSISNAAILQEENKKSYVLGQLDQSDLTGTDKWMLLTYENGTRYVNTCGNKTRSAAIIFICGQKLGNITVVEENCNYVFEFQLPGLCSTVPQATKKLSGSAIFFIILLCLVSTYLIGGFFYMRVKHGARGIDQIPNLDFWQRIGNFIGEKCDHCRCCKTNVPRTGYLFQESGPDLHVMDVQAIRYQRGSLLILDQLRLPDEILYVPINTIDDAWKAIHTMAIRGASAIAVCGVLSVAVELYHSRTKFDSISSILQFVTDQLNYLITARPTAFNMTEAAKIIIDYLIPLSNKQQNLTLYINELLDFMEQLLQRDLDHNRAIGQLGAEMIHQQITTKKKLTILTHANTGSLATVGFGTALGIIRQLNTNNLLQLVYFTETRPCNQGSRLTAYELVHDRIPHTMICDSMAGLLMRTQPIHAVLVGAERITANGDIANIIGTYQLAVLAKQHDIPFYVAAATTSIDLTTRTGNQIIIEQRPSSEMTSLKGMNIAAEGVQVWNPAFDITPAQLISSFITERGVFKPDELEEKLLTLQRTVKSPTP